jgi:hypothetical protein
MPTPSIIRVKDLPYLSCVPRDGRSIVVAPYYDSDAHQFYVCHPVPDGRMAILPAHGVLEGLYLAKRCADLESDRDMPFSQVVLQHFSYKDVWVVSREIERHLINGLASLHKYFVILLYAGEHEHDSYGPMITAELEYAFVNHRALYDRLHEIVRRIHQRCGGKGHNLPDSFARTANRSKQDLQDKHLLPQPLVGFYKDREEVFLKLRCVRDNILHHGHSPEQPFLFPDGIAVSVDDRLASQLGDFGLWPESLLRPNRLGSALAILEFLARDMFDVMDDLGSRLLSCFPDPPEPIARGYSVFLRSTVSRHLVSLDEYKQTHWVDPRRALGIAAPVESAPV